MPHRRRNRRPGENRRPQRLAEEPVDRIDLPGGARTALYVFSATAPGATPAAVDEAETRPGQEQQSAQTSVAMIVPALGVSAGSYLRFARALSDRGRHVLLADLRGVGNSTVRAGRHCDWGYLDLIDGELHSLWEKADTHFPGAEKLWVGHSLGGHLALMHQARHADQPVKRIELVASGSPWYPNYPGVYGWVTRALGRFAELSSRGLGAFPGHWIGFGGKQGARLMREWAWRPTRIARRQRPNTWLNSADQSVRLSICGMSTAAALRDILSGCGTRTRWLDCSVATLDSGASSPRWPRKGWLSCPPRALGQPRRRSRLSDFSLRFCDSYRFHTPLLVTPEPGA